MVPKNDSCAIDTKHCNIDDNLEINGTNVFIIYSFEFNILLFENELLLYSANCSIFKSNSQFLDPCLIDNNEKSP